MKRYCLMCDHWVKWTTCMDCDSKTLTANPWTGDIAPPETPHAVCSCGGGWTFDFAAKRVYCRACEESK